MALKRIKKRSGGQGRPSNHDLCISTYGAIYLTKRCVEKLDNPRFVIVSLDEVNKKIGLLIAQGHDDDAYSVASLKDSNAGRFRARPIVELMKLKGKAIVKELVFDKNTDVWVGTYKEEEV